MRENVIIKRPCDGLVTCPGCTPAFHLKRGWVYPRQDKADINNGWMDGWMDRWMDGAMLNKSQLARLNKEAISNMTKNFHVSSHNY